MRVRGRGTWFGRRGDHPVRFRQGTLLKGHGGRIALRRPLGGDRCFPLGQRRADGQTERVSQPPDQYDSPWKEALEVLLRSLLEFCFPAVAAAIDWSVPVEFLET